MFSQFAVAALASNFAYKKKLKSAKEIINVWEEFNDKLPAKTMADITAAMLTAGRIVDASVGVDSVDDVIKFYNFIREEVEKKIPEKQLNKQMLAAAFLSSRYIAATKKIETSKEMMTIFEDFMDNIQVANDEDFIAAVLSASRMLDAGHNIEPDNIGPIIKNVKDAFGASERKHLS